MSVFPCSGGSGAARKWQRLERINETPSLKSVDRVGALRYNFDNSRAEKPKRNSLTKPEDKMRDRASISLAFFTTAAVAFATTSFAQTSQSEKVEEIENSPVNCETAEQDLQLLASERERAENSSATSLTALSPVGALIGVAKGNEDEKLEILSGEYIEKIDQKTAEIKATCNL